jgi:hypothetical protein
MKEFINKLLYEYGMQAAPAPKRLARKFRLTGTIEVMLADGSWKKLQEGWEEYFRPGEFI